MIQFSHVGACCVGIEAATVVRATRIPSSAVDSRGIPRFNTAASEANIQCQKEEKCENVITYRKQTTARAYSRAMSL